MRIFKLALLLFFVTACASPTKKIQQGEGGQISQKAQKRVQEAKQKLTYPTKESKKEAISILQEVIKESPDYFEAYALIGSLYNQMKSYEKAVRYFDEAQKIDSAKLVQGYNMYAHAAAGTGDFMKALKLNNRYLQRPHLSERSRKKAMKWQKHYQFGETSKQKQYPFSPINLGDSVNSKAAEYLPVLTIDGKKLVFTRRKGQRENFFMSKKKKDIWSKAAPLETGYNKGIAERYNRGAETISQDGKLLLFTICDREDGYGNCDIYYSLKTKSGWSAARNIGPAINSPYWDTQPSLSPDGKMLYFVSNRPGGYGGSDIYVSHLSANGRWQRPENLGKDINTAGNESSPFIHADNRTLYFASDGHPGIGGVDLFYSRKKEANSWSKPHNLGYPINTIDHDGSIFVAADGKTAYFASNRADSRGALDIYTFTLYPQARPIKTLYVQGRVFDKKTGKELSVSIDLTNLKSGKKITNIHSDKNGHYLVTLPVGKDYAFHVSKKGYLFYSGNFSLTDSIKWQSYKIDIPLQPLEKNAHIVMKNVFFDIDKYTLRPESDEELDRVAQLLKMNPSLEIQINGYTDNSGTQEHNMHLSKNRAQAVVNYLISKDINVKRLKAKGFGESHPIATNETAEGRSENRRVALEIVGYQSGR